MSTHLDPRPDIVGDHTAWECLLATQHGRDADDQHGLYGVLHGLRCEGAELVYDGQRLRIAPGELGDEYPLLRKLWLLPRRDELAPLLAAVAQRLSGGIAA